MTTKYASLLKKAELLERMAVFGGERAFMSLGENFGPGLTEFPVQTISGKPDYSELGPGMIVFPEQTISGQNPNPDYTDPKTEERQMHSKEVYKPLQPGAYINPEVQKALFKLYPDTMNGSTVDSKFGTRTQGAMNKWLAEHHDNRAHADPSLQRDIILDAQLKGMKASSRRDLQEKYGF
jgi:hypothetical protein